MKKSFFIFAIIIGALAASQAQAQAYVFITAIGCEDNDYMRQYFGAMLEASGKKFFSVKTKASGWDVEYKIQCTGSNPAFLPAFIDEKRKAQNEFWRKVEQKSQTSIRNQVRKPCKKTGSIRYFCTEIGTAVVLSQVQRVIPQPQPYRTERRRFKLSVIVTETKNIPRNVPKEWGMLPVEFSAVVVGKDQYNRPRYASEEQREITSPVVSGDQVVLQGVTLNPGQEFVVWELQRELLNEAYLSPKAKRF